MRPLRADIVVAMLDLATCLAGHDSATALIQGGERLSYAELRSRVLRTAAGLRSSLPVGARVAVAADPCFDGVVGYLGVQAAGMVPSMVSSRSPRPELEGRLDQVEASHLVLGTAREVDVPSGVGLSRPAGTTHDDVPVLDGDEVAPHVSDVDDPAVVLYTSGVSGMPEPIVLTYGNLAATQRGLVGQPGSGFDAAAVALVALPISHVFGLNSLLGSLLSVGGKAVLVPDFDPADVVEAVARHRVTIVGAVPVMWRMIAQAGDRSAFSTVTRATFAAAAMPPGVPELVAENLGVEVAGGFGLTETAGTVVHDDPQHPVRGSVGRPLGETEMWVVDPSGAEVEAGDYGEIWLRGPSVARRRLDGSPLDITHDGWFRTGDLGALDDQGRLSIVGRQKDVINVSGFNVAPREVEAALLKHPAVESTVVVGELGVGRELVVAHVVAAEPVTESDLIEHCRTLLSRYKVPQRVHLTDELPITESGKAIRRLLQPEQHPQAS